MLPVMMGYWPSDGRTTEHSVNPVTLLSTDMRAESMSSVIRYCSETKMKEPVSCPDVIRNYNVTMGALIRDMLVHLYRTPMKDKR